MSHITWQEKALQVIADVYLRGSAAGAAKREIVQAIDDAYPFGERERYPYRCWLKVRRQFLVEHFLSQGTGAGLRNRHPSLPPGQKQLSLIPTKPLGHRQLNPTRSTCA